MHKSMSVALVRATHCPCSSSNSPLLFWHKSVADTRGSSSNNCVLTTYKEGVLLPLLPLLRHHLRFIWGKKYCASCASCFVCRSYPTPPSFSEFKSVRDKVSWVWAWRFRAELQLLPQLYIVPPGKSNSNAGRATLDIW